LDLIVVARSCHIADMSRASEYSSYVTYFKRFLKARGKRREDAEDLIQEAFLRLEKYCQQGNTVENAEAFLTRTMLNLSVSDHRHERPYLEGRTSLDSEILCDPAPTPDEVFAAEQRLQQIQAILDRVSQRTREAYFLHRLGGFSYAEIAKRFNCSVSLIEKHIASAATAIAHERYHGKLLDE
jgi:RNA polymerase sigma-70 factor (ECF subfamily)